MGVGFFGPIIKRRKLKASTNHKISPLGLERAPKHYNAVDTPHTFSNFTFFTYLNIAIARASRFVGIPSTASGLNIARFTSLLPTFSLLFDT
jgi:hypothetical protein